MIDELKEKLNLSEDEGKKLLEKLQDAAKESQQKLEEMAREEVKKACERVGVVTKEEVDGMKKKLLSWKNS